MPRLILPTTAVRDSFLEAMAEFRLEGRGGPSDDTLVGREEREHRETWESPEGFSDYVIKLREGALEETPRPEGWVPATTLWYVEGSTFLGRLSIRHRLTPPLLATGGHIGYDVRVSATPTCSWWTGSGRGRPTWCSVMRAPRSAGAEVTVTAAERLSIYPSRRSAPPGPAAASARASSTGTGPTKLKSGRLGPAPFTYHVVVVLDGVRYTATAEWPADEVDDNEPSAKREFSPGLTAVP